ERRRALRSAGSPPALDEGSPGIIGALLSPRGVARPPERIAEELGGQLPHRRFQFHNRDVPGVEIGSHPRVENAQSGLKPDDSMVLSRGRIGVFLTIHAPKAHGATTGMEFQQPPMQSPPNSSSPRRGRNAALSLLPLARTHTATLL